MNKVKNSFLENKEEILSNLPKELHEDFLKSMDNMSDSEEKALTGDDAVKAIKAELTANPSVDEAAAAGELKDIKAPEPVKPPSDEEIEKQKAQLLEEAKAQGPNENHED